MAPDATETETGQGVEVEKADVTFTSQTFKPKANDGYALIESVETNAGKRLLHPMKILLPEGSLTAIMGPSGSGKSTLLNTLTDSLSTNSKGIADSKFCDVMPSTG